MVWPYYAIFLALTVSNSSLFTPALLRTHSFVFFAAHKTRKIFLGPFISKALRRVSSFCLRVQLKLEGIHCSAHLARPRHRVISRCNRFSHPTSGPRLQWAVSKYDEMSRIYSDHFRNSASSYTLGGSVAEWLPCWTHAQKGPGSNRSRDVVG